MKIQEIIDRIIAYHPPMDADPQHPSCDAVKCGDPHQECSGMVVTCFASVDVIRKAIELGANFILVHEPLFWSDDEKTDDLADNPIYLAKKALLEQSNIVVWRDHDHIHGGKPSPKSEDGIYYGIMKELGWEPYLIGSKNKPLLYRLPETDATALGRELTEKLGLTGMRIVGDPHTKVSKVFIWEHIKERDWNGAERRKLLMMEHEDIDAIIPLETIDWTVCAFIRDSCQLGRPRVMFNPGHFNFEEIGMRHMLSYLPTLIGDTQLHFVPSGDSFGYLV